MGFDGGRSALCCSISAPKRGPREFPESRPTSPKLGRLRPESRGCGRSRAKCGRTWVEHGRIRAKVDQNCGKLGLADMFPFARRVTSGDPPRARRDGSKPASATKAFAQTGVRRPRHDKIQKIGETRPWTNSGRCSRERARRPPSALVYVTLRPTHRRNETTSGVSKCVGLGNTPHDRRPSAPFQGLSVKHATEKVQSKLGVKQDMGTVWSGLPHAHRSESGVLDVSRTQRMSKRAAREGSSSGLVKTDPVLTTLP